MDLKIALLALQVLLVLSHENEKKKAKLSSGRALSNDNLDSNKNWPLKIPIDPLLAAHYQNKVSNDQELHASSNYTVADVNEIELVEETTSRPPRQSGNGFLFRNSVYNPALTPSYNPYDPLSQRYDPLDPRYNPINPVYDPRTTTTFNGATPRDESGLDAFSARRAAQNQGGRGSKIIFQDTITQLGTSWNIQTSEFSPTVPGIFYFSFSAITDRYTYFRISLQLNGGDVVSAFGDINGYQMASNSALVKMNEGDRVYLTLQEGRLFDVSSSRAYTTFSGFRVL